MKKKVALVIDNDHFIKQNIPEWEEKFDLKIFNPPRSPPKIRTPLDLLRALKNKWEIRTKLPKLAKWADIVFCEWATHYLRWLSKKNYKNVLACRMHRFELDRHYDEIQWNNIDSVLFISEAMERKFRAKGDYEGKTFVTYDNLNFEDFPLIQKEKTMQIGMLGNIEPRKGVLEFVEHFGKMNLPEIKLSIAGKAKDATYYGKIKRHIVENNLESKITIEGYVKDLNDWYNSNDCIISNSIYNSIRSIFSKSDSIALLTGASLIVILSFSFFKFSNLNEQNTLVNTNNFDDSIAINDSDSLNVDNPVLLLGNDK